MAGNQITNAGFVDGTSGWGSSAGTVLSVDETIRGYEGRLVLKATKVVANAEGVIINMSDAQAVPVVAGRVLEVFAHYEYNRGPSYVAVNFYNAGGAFVASETVDRQSLSDQNPRLGLSKSYNFAHERITVPATATKARLALYGTATSAGASELMLMKPYLEMLPSVKTKYRCWDPGPSLNIDLSLPVWPADLPHIRADSFNLMPIPTRRGFKGDAGVMITKKLVNVPWYTIQASVRVDQELHAVLDKFFRTAAEPFWFVRPDTLQLCQATWLDDGDPVYSGLGSDKMATFGLQIRVI